MQAVLVSTLVVAVAEIGDKTQLLAIVLATRFKRPLPIVLGILVATLANHALAATAGALVSGLVTGTWFRVAVAVSFIAMGLWALVPDTLDERPAGTGGTNVFLTTLVAFFLVEIGDKTQVATAALGARFHAIVPVTIGTTLGMMLANVPAVYLGEAVTRIVPLRWVRVGAALVFVGLGVVALLEATMRPAP